MAYAALGAVHLCTAEVFLRDVLARHGFHNLRTSEEHVTDALQHDHEVGECGTVNGTAGAGAANAGNLGYDAAGLDVALEDFAKAGQSVDALLNAGTAGVVDAYAGRTHLHALVHDFAYLLRHGFRKRTTVDGEVLRKDVDQAAVDGTAAAHYAIAQILLLLHAEIVAAMEFEHVHFLKRTLIEEEFDAFTCRGFTLGVLLFDGLLAAAQAGLLAKLNKLLDFS